MAKVKYVGPHDAVEVPHLNYQRFENGVAVDVPSDQLGNFAEQTDWEVSGKKAKPEEIHAEPVASTTPETLPTEEEGN